MKDKLIEFETSKSLQEIARILESKVDFHYKGDSSSALISKDFYGDVISPGKFSFSKRPLISGLGDTNVRIDPKVDLEIQFHLVKIRIYDPSRALIWIANIILLFFAMTYITINLPGISPSEIAIPIAAFIVFSILIHILAIDRFKSTIRLVETKIIKDLK